MLSFEVSSLGQLWIKSMWQIMQKGCIVHDDGIRLKELCNICFKINSISEEDAIIQQYTVQDRIDLMKRKYSTSSLIGVYDKDYGSYINIINNNIVSQIDWLVNRLKNNPETKSAVISLHQPGEDQLPCLSLLGFLYRNNELAMNVVYRCQNAFSDIPGNLIALRLIQNDVAMKIGVKVGCVALHTISAYIYETDFKKVSSILRKQVLI